MNEASMDTPCEGAQRASALLDASGCRMGGVPREGMDTPLPNFPVRCPMHLFHLVVLVVSFKIIC